MFWHRYVDDVLVLWDGPVEILTTFLEWLNQLESNIKFTIEKETDGQINFLDLTIKRQGKKFCFDIYRKPSFSDVIIPASSNHPFNIKLSCFHSMIERFFNVPLSPNAVKREIATIKTIATNNGYKSRLIDKLIKRKEKKIILKSITALSPLLDKCSKYVKLTFIGNISYEIGKIIKENCNVKVAFYNNNILRNEIVNSKEKRDILDKQGVYEIKCENCEYIYIGQTGRNFKKRFNEHIASCKNVAVSSALARHLVEENHTSNICNLKVLHVEQKGKKLDILEAFEIDKAIKHGKQILNEQTDFILSPIVKVLF